VIAETSPPLGPAPVRQGLSLLEGATLAILLALAGTVDSPNHVLTGYRFGDSNHAITVPILKRLIDPSLYPGDAVVATGERFPTVFYRTLAAALPGTEWIPAAFFVLYVVSVAATLAGAYRIGVWAQGPAAGVVMVLMTLPVRISLAGEALFRREFSHSHLASALAIWAIVWFLEGRRLLPLLVLALGAYNHPLYSGYVLVPILLVVVFERKQVGARRTALLLAVALLPLVPLAAWGLTRGTPMTREWLELLRIRSAHHSFPSAFAADLPEAAALLGLAALASSRLDVAKRRLLGLFLVGISIQFLLGSLFTEFLPLKVVLQYQPHRSWRFLMLLLQAAVAAGVVGGFREGGLSSVLAAGTGLVAGIPGLEAWLPVALALQAGIGRPLASGWSRILAAAILVLVPGWGDRSPSYDLFADLQPRSLASQVTMGGAALAILVQVGRALSGSARRFVSLGAALGAFFWIGPLAYRGARVKWEYGFWRDVQEWARRTTPKAAVFLTPPDETGFRVFSERTIVGEWKDGTQQYFDDAFVYAWKARMDDLQRYPRFSDEELRALARRYGAAYVVLPSRPLRKGLFEVYRNREFAVYRP